VIAASSLGYRRAIDFIRYQHPKSPHAGRRRAADLPLRQKGFTRMTKLQIQSRATFTIAGLLTLFAPVASACLDQRTSGSAAASGLSVPALLGQMRSSSSGLLGSLSADQAAQSGDHSDHRRASIVGLWIATFYKNNTSEQFDVALAQFFADGNEIENDIAVPPRVQNTCYGVWEPTGSRSVKLKHIGWDFTNDVFDGSVLETATVRVSHDGNSFQGRYAFDQMDTAGNVIPSLHAEGVIKGVRFGFDEH
jgi:hypothetical protein